MPGGLGLSDCRWNSEAQCGCQSEEGNHLSTRDHFPFFLIIFNLPEFDRTSRSPTTSDQPEKFSSVFASDIDLNQKSGRDAYGHVVRAKSFSPAFSPVLESAEIAILLMVLVGASVELMSLAPAPSYSIGISPRSGDAKIAAMASYEYFSPYPTIGARRERRSDSGLFATTTLVRFLLLIRCRGNKGQGVGAI
jgi:hypothetical protein